MCQASTPGSGLTQQHSLALLIALWSFFLLSGCSQLPAQKYTASQLTHPPEYWSNRGKIAIHLLKPVPEQPARRVLSYRCEQSREKFQLDLSGTLGFGRVRIEQDSDSASITRGNEEIARAATLDSLLLSEAGVDIPVDQLKFWILGLALPTRPVEFLPSRNENDESGINGFRQSGWEIYFPLATEVHGRLLPAKIEGSSEDLELKIIVRDWQFTPDASATNSAS